MGGGIACRLKTAWRCPYQMHFSKYKEEIDVRRNLPESALVSVRVVVGVRLGTEGDDLIKFYQIR
jgi:hypothetical protein